MRTHRWLAGIALIAVAVLSGCKSTASFNEADLQGPTANLGGTWLSPTENYPFTIGQEGQTVTVTSFWRNPPFVRSKGTVRGRLYLSDTRFDAITVATDGMSAEWNTGVGHFTTIRKVILGSVSDDPGAGRNPVFEGGLICQLPFNPDGTLTGSLQGKYRRCVVQLTYLWTERLWNEGVPATKPFMQVTPLEEPWPTTIWDLVGKGGEKLTHFQAINVDVLRHARARSPLLAKRNGQAGGKPCWWILAPFNNRGRSWWGVPEDVLVGEFYLNDPDSGAYPLEIPQVARFNPKQGWELFVGMLLSESEWTGVVAVVEGGRPTGVTTWINAEPKIEDVLFGAESPRENALPWVLWRNRMALIAKTRTLPKVLAEYKAADLSNLALRIEQMFLDVTREAGMCRDKVQKMMESNAGDPSQLTNLAHGYQERLAVWKPILSAIKDEIANRGK